MGPVKLLFDSNILIGALNRSPTQRVDELLNGSETPAISVITWMEVLAGARPDRDRETRAFLALFYVYEITPEIAEAAVRIRKTTRLKLPDAVIYATALVAGRVLVTLNSRDFPPGTPSVLIPD